MKENDTEQTIFMTRPEGLARILALDDTSDLWEPNELRAIWQHQLSAPLELDLCSVKSSNTSRFKKTVEAEPFHDKSFADLIAHPNPPVELLKLAKEFAKHTLKHSEDAQLKEIASALYYASYAAGIVRCGKKIGSMEDDELTPGFKWALKQAWLDDQTKRLVSEAIDVLQKKTSG